MQDSFSESSSEVTVLRCLSGVLMNPLHLLSLFFIRVVADTDLMGTLKIVTVQYFVCSLTRFAIHCNSKLSHFVRTNLNILFKI